MEEGRFVVLYHRLRSAIDRMNENERSWQQEYDVIDRWYAWRDRNMFWAGQLPGYALEMSNG